MKKYKITKRTMGSGEVLSKMKDVLQSDQLRYFSSEGISLSKQKLEVENTFSQVFQNLYKIQKSH